MAGITDPLSSFFFQRLAAGGSYRWAAALVDMGYAIICPDKPKTRDQERQKAEIENEWEKVAEFLITLPDGRRERATLYKGGMAWRGG